jgi:hypothetical protein
VAEERGPQERHPEHLDELLERLREVAHGVEARTVEAALREGSEDLVLADHGVHVPRVAGTQALDEIERHREREAAEGRQDQRPRPGALELDPQEGRGVRPEDAPQRDEQDLPRIARKEGLERGEPG